MVLDMVTCDADAAHLLDGRLDIREGDLLGMDLFAV